MAGIIGPHADQLARSPDRGKPDDLGDGFDLARISNRRVVLEGTDDALEARKPDVLMIKHFGESEAARQIFFTRGGEQRIEADGIAADDNHSDIAVVVQYCAD